MEVSRREYELRGENDVLRARVERLEARERKAWFRGHCDAIGTMIRQGEETLARELLQAAGVATMAEARRAGAEERDLQVMRPILVDIRRRRDDVRRRRA